MKKMLLLVIAIVSMGSIQAQEFSINGGSGFTSNHIKVEGDSKNQRFLGYAEGEFDFLQKSKFTFGPVMKLYFYDGSLGRKINNDENNYAFSGGLGIGYDFGDMEFNISGELPIPDHREGIFEGVISPSLVFVGDNGFGLKINFDYFVNQKLFTYQSAITAGLVYKFN